MSREFGVVFFFRSQIHLFIRGNNLLHREGKEIIKVIMCYITEELETIVSS